MKEEGSNGQGKGREGKDRKTHHNNKRIPIKEPSIHIRDEPNRERAHRSRDVALVPEARAREVVRDPANARDRDEHVQLAPVPRRVVAQAEEERVRRHREERCQVQVPCSVRFSSGSRDKTANG